VEIGEYYVSLFGTEAEGFSRSQIFGYGIPYSDEFNNRSVNYALLRRLASITKGRVLKPEDNPDDLFTANSHTKEYGRRLWPYLTLVSLFLLIADVVVRKFVSLGRII
jgi:hypothetical protein